MQRTKPKLKVDRIFGPELVPQRKGFSASAWLLVLFMAGGMAALYQYVTPIWLCYRLEQDLNDAKTADEAGLAAENLLALGDDGLEVVVGALADSRVEISGVAFQVLKGRLDAMTKEELLESEWVRSLAGELRKAAGTWSGESKQFGCQLANAIYSSYETQGNPQQEDKLRWASARLDTWAVLENHQWTVTYEPLRTNSPQGDVQPSTPNSMLSDSGSNSSIRASTGSTSNGDVVGPEGAAATPPSASIADSGSSNVLSIGGGSLLPIDYQNPDAKSGVDASVGDSSSGAPGVRFGDLRQTETGEEPMAHIQVIPKNRRAPTMFSNTPRGINSQPIGYDSAVATPGNEVAATTPAPNVGEGESSRWEGKIQRIDTRSPGLDLALKQKDVLELFMLLKSENISEQAAAVRELDERGLSNEEIALATNLVRGDSAARIKLLSELPRMEIADPSRWYIWMAQNEDREVRRVAILGLGSVADPGIATMIRELRVHEVDRELKDLLQRILQAIER